MTNNTATMTLIRKSLYRRCEEAALAKGWTFRQEIDPACGGRIVYVVNGISMTPGEAAKMLEQEIVHPGRCGFWRDVCKHTVYCPACGQVLTLTRKTEDGAATYKTNFHRCAPSPEGKPLETRIK